MISLAPRCSRQILNRVQDDESSVQYDETSIRFDEASVEDLDAE